MKRDPDQAARRAAWIARNLDGAPAPTDEAVSLIKRLMRRPTTPNANTRAQTPKDAA